MSDTDSKREFTRFERVDIAQYKHLLRITTLLSRHRYQLDIVKSKRLYLWIAGAFFLFLVIMFFGVSYLAMKNIYFSVCMAATTLLYFSTALMLKIRGEDREEFENKAVKPISSDLEVLNKLSFDEWNALYDKANELDRLVRESAQNIEEPRYHEAIELLKEVSEVEPRVKSFLENLDRFCEIEMRGKDNPDEILRDFAINTRPFFSPDNCDNLFERVIKTLKTIKQQLIQINEGTLMLVDHGEDFGALSISKYREEQGAVSMIPREENSSDDKDHD